MSNEADRKLGLMPSRRSNTLRLKKDCRRMTYPEKPAGAQVPKVQDAGVKSLRQKDGLLIAAERYLHFVHCSLAVHFYFGKKDIR